MHLQHLTLKLEILILRQYKTYLSSFNLNGFISWQLHWQKIENRTWNELSIGPNDKILLSDNALYMVVLPQDLYLLLFICCLCCSADGSYEVKLLTKAIVYHSGDILWQPPAIYKGRIRSGILLKKKKNVK